MDLPDDYRAGQQFGYRDRQGRLVLDAAAARDLNEIKAELRRLAKFSASPPLEYSSDASGRHLAVSLPRSVYAKLSGTSSPYSWSEAVRTAGGASSVLAGGRAGTTNAYEANSISGLANKYATLDWSVAGDWRFQATGPASGGGGGPTPGFGACCPSGPVPATVTLTFTFRPGTNAATYNHQLQNTTLTYMSSPPSYDPSLTTNKYWSPLMTDDFSQMFYYRVACTSAQFTLGFGFNGFTPSTCLAFATYACSPFLVSGVTSGSTFNCSGFGAAGDNAVVS